MRLLFDHNVDRRFRRHLPEHFIQTTRELRFEQLANGLLLQAASDTGFDAILCIDKKIEYEQNLAVLPLSVIVLDAFTNAIHGLAPFAPHLLKLLGSPLEKRLYFIDRNGNAVCVTAPRPKC